MYFVNFNIRWALCRYLVGNVPDYQVCHDVDSDSQL